MKRTTITIPAELIDELMHEIDAKTKTEAVIRAIKDEIRSIKKKRIKEMAGKMEFIETADQLRHGDKRLG
ncbi:MAG: DUF2191 domain-containing protein [Nitrospirae bacterium]|nr:MAG: DUF2191 domain-containing protein [Nitrospirota bacterium]